MIDRNRIYKNWYRVFADKNDRLWWIDEGHLQTNEEFAVCRAVERGCLMHTAIIARRDLKAKMTMEILRAGS